MKPHLNSTQTILSSQQASHETRPFNLASCSYFLYREQLQNLPPFLLCARQSSFFGLLCRHAQFRPDGCYFNRNVCFNFSMGLILHIYRGKLLAHESVQGVFSSRATKSSFDTHWYIFYKNPGVTTVHFFCHAEPFRRIRTNIFIRRNRKTPPCCWFEFEAFLLWLQHRNLSQQTKVQ